jgi:antitoxin ParD1/3/4
MAREIPSKGVCARAGRDAAFEQWLRDEVIAGHQEYLADPSQAIPAEDILARIKARRAGQRQAGYPEA